MAGRKPDKVVDAIAATLDAFKADAVPIEGGPVVVPIGRVAALWLIPWMCEPDVRVGARLLPPKGKKRKALYATWGDTRHAFDILREFTIALASVQSGTLELLAAASADVNDMLAGDDPDHDFDEDPPTSDVAALAARRHAAARFRMIGTVTDDAWTITHARPHVSASQLTRALEILAMVDSPAPFKARDEEEAQLVSALAARSASFIRTNPAQVRANALSVDGASLFVADEKRPALAMILFRHRLANGPWDMQTQQQVDEHWLVEYVESLRVMNERAQRRTRENAI